MSSGEQWEREVATYLRNQGYHTRVRATLREHEIDVYATRGNDKLVVECKDWTQPVSKDPVRTVHNNADDLGATPALAYTSQLASGAQRLAEEYGIVLFSAQIVRGTTLTKGDVREAAEAGIVCLPGSPPINKINDPLDPFWINSEFSSKIVEKAKKAAFITVSDMNLKNQIQSAIKDCDARRCVPVLKQNEGQIELYFISTTEHDALPDRVERSSVQLF